MFRIGVFSFQDSDAAALRIRQPRLAEASSGLEAKRIIVNHLKQLKKKRQLLVSEAATDAVRGQDARSHLSQGGDSNFFGAAQPNNAH